MGGALKGLMKGLRYITSMFETEREPDIQIGGPTDVKHVAHIGWDGPTANAPSWMDKFKGEGEGGEEGDPAAHEGDAATTTTTAETKQQHRSKGGKTSRKKKAKGASASGGAKAKAKTSADSHPENDLQGG